MPCQRRGASIHAVRVEQREQFGSPSTRILKVNTVTVIRSPMFAAIRASSLAGGAPPARAERAIHSASAYAATSAQTNDCGSCQRLTRERADSRAFCRRPRDRQWRPREDRQNGEDNGLQHGNAGRLIVRF